MTVDQLEEMGLTWEQLPSGRWNLESAYPFSVNGNPTIIRHKGKFVVTFDQRTKEAVLAGIKTLTLI